MAAQAPVQTGTKTAPGAKQATQVPPIPFRKATIEKSSLEARFNMVNQSGELNQDYSQELSSKGYMARVYLEVAGVVTTANGDPGAGEDWPYSLFKSIELTDTNGGTIKRMSGYAAEMAARYFSHRQRTVAGSAMADIMSKSISAVQANNIAFRIPLDVETNPRDNLGLLPNQNASFKYTIDTLQDLKANLFTTPANVTYTRLTLTPQYDYYTVPAAVRADGRPQQTRPPFLGAVRQMMGYHKMVTPVNDEGKYDLTPGKVLRNLLIITRKSGSAPSSLRINGIDQLQLLYGDDVTKWKYTGQGIRSRMYERFNEEPPTGVYVLNFDDDGDVPGYDYRRDYIDTRALSQIYMNIVTQNDAADLEIVEDLLVLPGGMSL